MTRSVVWRPAARADLFNLYDWIAAQTDRDTAYDYTSRVEEYAGTLTDFAERGSPRGDYAPGVRTIVYRRRTVIAYTVSGDDVEILRLAHRGRDLGRLFADED